MRTTVVSGKGVKTVEKTGPLIHCKQKLIVFPVTSRDVANQTIYYSPPGRVWLVTSRLGTRKIITFFYSVCDASQLEDPLGCVEPCHWVGGPERGQLDCLVRPLLWRVLVSPCGVSLSGLPYVQT
jgi:hypothetical protein